MLLPPGGGPRRARLKAARPGPWHRKRPPRTALPGRAVVPTCYGGSGGRVVKEQGRRAQGPASRGTMRGVRQGPGRRSGRGSWLARAPPPGCRVERGRGRRRAGGRVSAVRSGQRHPPRVAGAGCAGRWLGKSGEAERRAPRPPPHNTLFGHPRMRLNPFLGQKVPPGCDSVPKCLQTRDLGPVVSFETPQGPQEAPRRPGARGQGGEGASWPPGEGGTPTDGPRRRGRGQGATGAARWRRPGAGWHPVQGERERDKERGEGDRGDRIGAFRPPGRADRPEKPRIRWPLGWPPAGPWVSPRPPALAPALGGPALAPDDTCPFRQERGAFADRASNCPAPGPKSLKVDLPSRGPVRPYNRRRPQHDPWVGPG